MSSCSKQRSTKSLATGDGSCHQTVLQKATKPLHCGIFVSIANGASALSVVVMIYLISLMIQIQYHLVSTLSPPSPVANGSERFTLLHVIVMVREKPYFLSAFPAKVLDFVLFCDVTTATVVNLRAFKASYPRKCKRKKSMAATPLQTVVPIFTWELLTFSLSF